MSYNVFASASDTIKTSVLTGLGTRLQAFQNKHIQDLTSYSDIDLSLPGKKPCAYYCITNDMNSDMDFLISLFFTFLFIKLVRYADGRPDGKCENKVFFLLDEFANIGAIPDFNKKISTVRSRDIALIPIVQNVGQLKNRYPQDVWQEIVGNCDTRICLGTTDILSAQYFSDLFGVSTIENMSIKKSNGIDGELEYGQKNISTLKRNLINPDEILRLSNNKLIISLRGNKPLLLDKVIYSEHPLSKELKVNQISSYNPIWKKENNKIQKEKKTLKNKVRKENRQDNITFDNF